MTVIYVILKEQGHIILDWRLCHGFNMQLYHNMNNTQFQVKCQYQVKCQCMRRSLNSICLHTNTTMQ